MVPNPATFENGKRQLKDTLQRRSSKKPTTANSRPAMRCRSSMSVEELSMLTRKMNMQTAEQNGMMPINLKKMPFGRSNSAPADLEVSKMIGQRIRNPAERHSYSDGSVSSTSSSNSYMDHLVNVPVSTPIAPPSRYHTSARYHRRVTFNERVEVFELPFIPAQEAATVEQKQKAKRMKNDTVKFHDQKSLKRPTSRVQKRMTSYIKDKLKAN